VFGKGWGRRVAEVKSAALAMAAGATTQEMPSAPAPGRAVVPLAKGAQQGSTGAVIAAGAAAAQQAHQSGARPLFVAAVVGAAVVAAIAAWLFWHWRQKRQQEA
jgi:lysozyme family protein